MMQLALLGGRPVFDPALNWRKIWPPVDGKTEEELIRLYRSRLWTAYDEAELDFARAFAEHSGVRHGVFTMNGTVTLQCALSAYGVGPGDEVIVPALTWYAAAIPPHYLGATPVLVDVERDTLCIDPQKLEAAITERTKAVIPVHLYGSMADMDAIMDIARRHDLRVVEDCAHAHGGIWAGKRIGSIGGVGSFSFQHSKTMSSAEGGICITNDTDVAERMFRLTHIGYGPGEVLGHAKSGPPDGLLCYPFRATAFQAVILHEQLRTLDERVRRYGESARYLETRLGQSTKIRFQKRGRKADQQGYFGWAMIFDDPAYSDVPLQAWQKALNAEGLPVMPTWAPVYRFVLFNLRPSAYRVPEPCAVTEHTSARLLWLLHPLLGLAMPVVEAIADAIEKVASNVDELRRYATETGGST
jgi:L-glutamine:2-deoxy-scyllo-inosose/3-amino-2,3-dideoxy-scyllo-inosose aminotransferase